MDYYKIMKKETFSRRIAFGVIIFIIGLLLVMANVGEIKNYFDGPVKIDALDVESRDLSKLYGEYVTVTVTDLQGYVNGFDGEQKGLLFGMFPTTKSGWVAGYNGCVQYCELITYGKYNDQFQQEYEKLVAYDDGLTEKPDVSITVTGKVVRKSDRWASFFNQYASELVSAGSYSSIAQVKAAMSGDYMIDMSYGKPVRQCVLFLAGIILIFAAAMIILGYFLGNGRKKMRVSYKKYGKQYSKDFIYDDYSNGYAIGSTVISNRFLYYIKGLDYEMFPLEKMEHICRKKRVFISKIVITDLKGKKHSFYVHKKHGKKIAKVVTSVLDEIAEFGIID